MNDTEVAEISEIIFKTLFTIIVLSMQYSFLYGLLKNGKIKSRKILMIWLIPIIGVPLVVIIHALSEFRNEFAKNWVKLKEIENKEKNKYGN